MSDGEDLILSILDEKPKRGRRQTEFEAYKQGTLNKIEELNEQIRKADGDQAKTTKLKNIKF